MKDEKINNFVSGIKICNTPERLQILKLLYKTGDKSFGQLMKLVEITNSGLMAYHLRVLKRFELVELHREVHLYSITRKGRFLIKIVDELQEKYINEDSNLICRFNSDRDHKNVTICRACGMTLEEQRQKKEILV